MVSSPSASDAPARLGPYRLGRCLGRGGMGVVYEAVGPARHPVALKLLTAGGPGGSGVNVHRFLDEARLGASLDHPNVVRTLASGIDQGHAWLAMERLEGATLSAVHQVPAPGVDLSIALAIAAQVLDAFDYLHRQMNVVHRDIKPSNLFITSGGVVKLIDFGIAQAEATDSTATATGTMRGSFPFMAPEYLRGEDVDGRSDIYALGLVLYELLAGDRVFKQPSHGALVSAVLFSHVLPLRARRPELPAPLEAEVMRMIARDRTVRPSAAECRAALGAAAGQEPASNAELAAWLAEKQLELAQQTAEARGLLLTAPASPASLDRSSPLDPGPPHAGRARLRAVARVMLGVSLIGAGIAAGAWWRSEREPPPPPPSPPVAALPKPSPERARPAPPVEERRPEPAPPAKRHAAPRSAKGARAVGYVSIDSVPVWANISIDGASVGPTPLFRHEVPVGVRRIEVVTADGRRKSSLAKVTRGKDTRVLFEW